MHRVIFLPLTAPLAPADANRMRKQNARLCAAEVAGERSAEAAVGWSVSPGQAGEWDTKQIRRVGGHTPSFLCVPSAPPVLHQESGCVTEKYDLKTVWRMSKLFGRFPSSSAVTFKIITTVGRFTSPYCSTLYSNGHPKALWV